MSDSFATPWTVAHQALLFMKCPRQEYWSGLPFPYPGLLLILGIKTSSPSLAGEFFTTEPPGKLSFNYICDKFYPTQGLYLDFLSTLHFSHAQSYFSLMYVIRFSYLIEAVLSGNFQ